jgi:hypothetical protein
MPAEYVPTADQRALVENAAAFGITQADIAEQLGEGRHARGQNRHGADEGQGRARPARGG